ncbi:MAG: polyphosphate kinase 1 [Pseudomonadota bacterium]|nr:polyphosphate kinase 1 [Pseudomonadota bacterium]
MSQDIRPEHFINRWHSLLRFNLRVLEQSLNPHIPLLERLKFLTIFSSNMDEFFEVRLGPIIHQVARGEGTIGADGIDPLELVQDLKQRCHEAVEKEYSILNDILLPELEQQDISFLRRNDWDETVRIWLKNFYTEQVEPVLTPIAVDLSHPFPRLVNKSLNFIVSLRGKDAFGRMLDLAIVPAPRSLPRVIQVPAKLVGGKTAFVFLSSIIHDNVSSLFPGMSIEGCYQFRITRNADFNLDETNVDDLPEALESEIFSSRFADAVRLEVADNCPNHLVDFLLQETQLTKDDLYRVNGPVNLARLMGITGIDRSELKFPSFTPKFNMPLMSDEVFSEIRQRDHLLHHPYESFAPVVNLVKCAARDPNVLAIKQTLYRTQDDSKLVDYLCEAARNGKEVTVVIELRARFDEANNIEDARELKEAGVVVVYGVVGYKTHAKLLMIVRKEAQGIRRYVHLGTGNYHEGTAKLYTDLGYLTSNHRTGLDVNSIFQELTGTGAAAQTQTLLHAPFTLHAGLLELIEKETQQAKAGQAAHIRFKMNSLTEPEIIRALYRASQAGVNVELIVRGMCCLRPGIKGVSENIVVRSIISRFLEHSRVYWFKNSSGEAPIMYCGSADLMERNLFKRVEVCFRVDNPKLRERIEQECFELALQDTGSAWILQSDGSYLPPSAKAIEGQYLQEQLIDKLAFI